VHLSIFTISHKASNFVFAHINYYDAPVSLNARLKRFLGRHSECTPLLSKVSSDRTCCVHSRLFCKKRKKKFEKCLSIDLLLICTKLKQWELDLCISCNNFCRIYFLRNMLQQKRYALHCTAHLRKHVYNTIKKFVFSLCACPRTTHKIHVS